MHIKKLLLILGIAFTTQLASCANTTAGSVAGVNRSQFMLLPESQVVSMSNASYLQTLQEAGSKKP